jgi:hypothetical protein
MRSLSEVAPDRATRFSPPAAGPARDDLADGPGRARLARPAAPANRRGRDRPWVGGTVPAGRATDGRIGGQAGIAEWDGQEGPEQLVGRADRALYEAKHAGRDRIIAAPSPSGHHPDTRATSPLAPETAPPATQINTKTH